MVNADWRQCSLGDVVKLQRGFDLPSRNRRPGAVPIVTSSGVGGTHCESMVVAPGVVTGRYGTIGDVFFLEQDFWPLNTTLFAKDFQGNDPQFVASLLRTIDFHSHGGKSGVPGVNRNDLHALLVRVPESVDEQRAISSVVRDADALLGALDRLIAKKRDLKQAAMQQLLTGQTRLPGFQGEWGSTTFGQIAQPRRDRVDPRSSGKQDFCVELEHIAPAGGELLGFTSAGEYSSIKSVFSTGDVLFGKLRAYLRKYWLATRSGVCSTEIWVLAPRSELTTTQFLFQLVTTDDFIEAASNSYGTHMPRSDWSIVKNFEIALPPVPEQMAIAVVLFDMDAELTTLEARRDKTCSLKQAMMQALLTGRTRLV